MRKLLFSLLSFAIIFTAIFFAPQIAGACGGDSDEEEPKEPDKN